MSLFTELDNMDRIAALESKVTKQQAEINRLVSTVELTTATLKKMAAVLETISAGK